MGALSPHESFIVICEQAFPGATVYEEYMTPLTTDAVVESRRRFVDEICLQYPSMDAEQRRDIAISLLKKIVKDNNVSKRVQHIAVMCQFELEGRRKDMILEFDDRVREYRKSKEQRKGSA